MSLDIYAETRLHYKLNVRCQDYMERCDGNYKSSHVVSI